MAQIRSGTVICPRCQKDDHVEKVSAVFFAAVSTETFAGLPPGVFSLTSEQGTDRTRASVNQTSLAQLLSPPSPPPIYKKPWGTVSIGLVGGAVIFALMSGFGLISGGPMDPPFNTVLGVVLIDIVLLGTVILIVLKKQRTASKRLAEFETHLFRWRRASDIWEQLYYCHRDAIVFLPGKPESCHPSEMTELLYEP